jgi:sugar phosphate isomerase/epimerase
VKKRFADSPVELVGYGSNCQFHEDDPKKVQANIDQAKAYLQLMHDCGGTGLKVKPNGFVKGVDHSRTIEQIGKAFNEVAKFGAKLGQQVRVEVHRKETQKLPNIKAIMDVADHPNMTVCWNSNGEDLAGEGLKHNFDLVKVRFGATVHVREMNIGDYPYADLFKHFVAMDYKGWILLECRTKPKDTIVALKEQKHVFETIVKNALG